MTDALVAAQRRIFNRSFLAGCLVGSVGAVLVTVVGLVAAALILRPYLPSYSVRNFKPPLVPNQRADYNWTVTPLDGQAIAFDQMKGRVLFLMVWDPDCVICLATMPSVQALYERVAQTGVEFFCVSKAEDAEGARAVAAEKGWTLPFYTYAGSLPEAYKGLSRPAIFIIDHEGNIAMKQAGGALWNDDSVAQFLNSLMVKAGMTPAQ